MKKLQLFLAAICLFAFSACSTSPASSESAQSIVKEYLDCVVAGKFDKAVDCFYFNEEASKAEMKALAAKLEEGFNQDGGVKSYEILSEEVFKDEDGNAVKTKTEVKLYFNNGKEEEETITSVKVEGKWKIDFSVKG